MAENRATDPPLSDHGSSQRIASLIRTASLLYADRQHEAALLVLDAVRALDAANVEAAVLRQQIKAERDDAAASSPTDAAAARPVAADSGKPTGYVPHGTDPALWLNFEERIRQRRRHTVHGTIDGAVDRGAPMESRPAESRESRAPLRMLRPNPVEADATESETVTPELDAGLDLFGAEGDGLDNFAAETASANAVQSIRPAQASPPPADPQPPDPNPQPPALGPQPGPVELAAPVAPVAPLPRAAQVAVTAAEPAELAARTEQAEQAVGVSEHGASVDRHAARSAVAAASLRVPAKRDRKLLLGVLCLVAASIVALVLIDGSPDRSATTRTVINIAPVPAPSEPNPPVNAPNAAADGDLAADGSAAKSSTTQGDLPLAKPSATGSVTPPPPATRPPGTPPTATPPLATLSPATRSPATQPPAAPPAAAPRTTAPRVAAARPGIGDPATAAGVIDRGSAPSPIAGNNRAPSASGPVGTGGVVRTTPGDGRADSGDRTAVRGLLDSYQAAYTRLDASAVAEIWPRVPLNELTRAFSTVRRQDVMFDQCTVSVSGERATAQCIGRLSYVPAIGAATTRVKPLLWRFQLAQRQGAWVIDDISTE